jgi:hypothetical protein
MIDGYYIFPDKNTADAAIAAAGFELQEESNYLFTHANGQGKFWGEGIDPIGVPLIPDPNNADQNANWIYLDGVHFFCRMYGTTLPSALSSYYVSDTSLWLETYGEYLQTEETA